MKSKSQITYTYYSDGKSITIRAGKDGVTETDITILKNMDHEEKLNNRYEEKDNRDFKMEGKKLKFAEEPEKCVGDPIEELPAKIPDIIDLIENQEEHINPDLEKLEAFIELLTPQQKELIYEIYGSKNSLTEIAKEQGVSVPAIHNRKSKIINRLSKLFEKTDKD